MNRITLKCVGVLVSDGACAAKDMERAFSENPRHVDVHCWWDGKALFVTAWNDFDETGLALREEFSDLLLTHVPGGVEGEIETVEVLSMR